MASFAPISPGGWLDGFVCRISPAPLATSAALLAGLGSFVSVSHLDPLPFWQHWLRSRGFQGDGLASEWIIGPE
jgi:hypothetical protein